MADAYDPLPDLTALVISALYGRRDVTCWAEKVAMGCWFDDEASPETVAGALREALGVPGPRSVTYDMTDKDAWLALDTALEDFSVAQRDRARGERGNERRHEWADLADSMRQEAEDARNAPSPQAGGGRR